MFMLALDKVVVHFSGEQDIFLVLMVSILKVVVDDEETVRCPL